MEGTSDRIEPRPGDARVGTVADDTPAASPRTNLGNFQPAMSELVEAAERVDLRDFETLSALQVRQKLHPVVFVLVQRARALVGSILDDCERHSAQMGARVELEGPLSQFEHAIDAAVEAGDASIRAVEDVAFLVQIELRQREERLRRVSDASDALAVIGECDSALRRIRKGLGAIDVAIARAESSVPRIDFSSELEQSLLVRGAYAKFRTRLLSEGTPGTATELYIKMRAAGTHMAVLVGWKAYPLLRVRDRLQLRELQRRILSWLLPERRTDTLAGTRLWQDITSFVEMLAQVNRRQELLKHDARLVEQTLVLLADRDGTVDEPTLTSLAPLKGMDDELDTWLAAEGPRSVNGLRDRLRRLARDLGVSTPEGAS
jgi:hypothetical protein